MSCIELLYNLQIRIRSTDVQQLLQCLQSSPASTLDLFGAACAAKSLVTALHACLPAFAQDQRVNSCTQFLTLGGHMKTTILMFVLHGTKRCTAAGVKAHPKDHTCSTNNSNSFLYAQGKPTADAVSSTHLLHNCSKRDVACLAGAVPPAYIMLAHCSCDALASQSIPRECQVWHPIACKTWGLNGDKT